MSDKHIKDAFDSISVNKEKIDKAVVSEVSGMRAGTKAVKYGKVASRKSIAIAAAMVVVLAFGAVIYETGLFDLGKLNDPHNSGLEYEYPALEESNQYKAALEYNKYLDSLSQKEKHELFSNNDNVFIMDEETGVMTSTGPNEKLKEILKKHNLKYDLKEFTNIPSVQIAAEKTGLSGFSDDFIDKYDDGKGGYKYTENGKLMMHNHMAPNYWELVCCPNDVFIGEEAFNYPNSEREKGTEEEWFYLTKDGHEIKCATYKIKGAYEDGKGNETPAMMRVFLSIMITDEYTFMFNYDKTIEDTSDMTKSEFEEILELFDYSKLD